MRSDKKLKRAQAEHIVLIVIFLLVLSTMLYVYAVYKKGLSGATPKEICKTSVKMNAASHVGDLYIDSDLKCPTQYINIDKRKKEEVMGELAKYMYDCWDMFWEGDLNIFPQKESRTINYCVICHHIIFKEKMKISTNEFLDYLSSYNVPNQEKTFQQYLGSTSTKDNADFENPIIFEGNIDLNDLYIDTSVPYVTMFSYNKQGYWQKLSTTLIGSGAGTGAGIVIGIVGIILAPVSAGTTLILTAGVLGGTIGLATGATIGYAVGSPKAADWQSNIQLMPYEVSQLKDMQCDYLPVSQSGGNNE